MLSLQNCAYIVVGLPLVAALIIGLLNKHISRKLAHTVGVSCLFAACLASSRLVYAYFFKQAPSIDASLYQWGSCGGFDFHIGLKLDTLSVGLMSVVTVISFLVHCYSIGYMHEDKSYQRFFAYIALFTFGMQMLVIADNYLQLFFGWEAVGVVSYLLIGFWFTRDSATHASLKAFLVNRLGDIGFLLGIGVLVTLTQSFDYATLTQKLPSLLEARPVFNLNGELQMDALNLAALLLFIGAMAKSAQIPLHNWLPDSMEGPTPISALIHAATMVTAGIFMVARFSYLFEACPAVLNFILFTGSLTSLSMGLLGLIQSDIKRVIAYSTLSQLGYMVAALGASHYDRAVFHLFTHAFFKALLFLGAGSVILSVHHEQNIWKMGGLRRYLPITYLSFLLGSCALCGVPFTSGFYSKDLIIEGIAESTLTSAPFAYYALLAGVFVTALYSFRLLIVVFHNRSRLEPHTLEHLKESPWSMRWPLIILSIPALAIGFWTVGPMMDGILQTSVGRFHAVNFEGAWSMGLASFKEPPFFLSLAGLSCALIFYKLCPEWPAQLQRQFKMTHQIMDQKYGFDGLYEEVVGRSTRVTSWFLARLMDYYVIDRSLVNGSAERIRALARTLSQQQSGKLFHYVTYMVLGLISALGCLAWYLQNTLFPH